MIVIGVDVHKHSLTAVAVDEAGRMLDERTAAGIFTDDHADGNVGQWHRQVEQARAIDRCCVQSRLSGRTNTHGRRRDADAIAPRAARMSTPRIRTRATDTRGDRGSFASRSARVCRGRVGPTRDSGRGCERIGTFGS
jgi:hypothetical protein